MASNKHFDIDLKKHEITETEAPTLEEILRLADLPNSLNPFGNELKRGKFVNDGEKKWLLDEQLTEFNYQISGYENKISQFSLVLSFDTALKLTEIDADRFLYSVSRRIAQSSWRNHERGGATFFRMGQLEKGSIRGEIYAGVVAVGAFVANYPDLKAGFYEILSDTQFLTEQISSAVRAAKLPTPLDENGGNGFPLEQPPALLPQRGINSERQRLIRDD